MSDLNFNDDMINLTPIIYYIDYIHLLQDDFYKRNYPNITPRDVTYLMNIFYYPNSSQKDLSDLLFVSESNVTQIIKRLDKNNFILRTADESNKSRKIINLTEKGKIIVFKLLKDMYEWECEFFSDYSPEEVEKFKKMLYEYAQKTVNSNKMFI